MTIQQYLLKSFTQNSENIAIIHDGISLSYEELYASVLKIASVLSEKKLEQASIALIYENKLQLVIAMLGVILSRNTFVPIPCKTPLARIKQILQISSAQLILSDQESILDTGVEEFNSLKLFCDFKLTDYTPKSGEIDDLSHIYFTSGSTGEPKGIKGRNGSLLSFMLWMIKEFEIGKQDRVMQIAGEGFSLFKREVLATLISGATLVIPTEADKSSFDSVAKFIRANDITVFNIVPSYYNYLVDYLSSIKHPKLRLIFIAGEILYKSLVNKHIHAFNNHCRLINLYGPTETTQAKFYYEIDFNNYQFAEMMPVGLPINDVTTAYIRNDSGILIDEASIVGEIIIATDDISYGYCNISQNTPFIEINGKKAFCSGDLGYKDQFGLLHVLGRADSQIKIRGMRVELSEIEAHILNIDVIQEVAVLYMLSESKHEGQLVAALVGNATRGEIIEYFSSHLPDYMLPVKFIYLDNLPKNRNNKIDRLALSKIIQEENSLAASMTAKKNEANDDTITAKLIAIWQEYFPQPFSIYDDFFILGGSSLLIMAIASKIKEAFNHTPALNIFYEKRTIVELAQYLHVNQDSQSQPIKAALIHEEYSNNYFPLTHIQQAYLLGRFGDYKLGGIATQRYVEYSYSQHLDYVRLEAAINQLIKRHAMLRTTFSVDRMVQITHSEYNYQLHIHDYSIYSEKEFQHEVLKIRTEMLGKKLDVAQLPLFEIKISRGANGDRLHFLSDILIMDAHSLNIFRQELTLLYHEHKLDEVELTFRDYIESKSELGINLAYLSKFYWFQRFKEVPNFAPLRTLQLPESVTHPVFARDSRVIEASIWQEFKNKAYKNNVSPTSALLTIYYHVLARYSTNPNFLINISLFDKSNSSVAENNIIGDFTDILAFLPYVGNEKQFINQVRRNHSLLWKDLEHRAIDGIEVFSIIRQKFNLDSDVIIAPMVFTSLLEDSKTNIFLENNAQEEFYLSQTAQVWLDNNAIENNGNLISGWDYVSQLFDIEHIENLHMQYINLIEHFAHYSWDNEIPDLIASSGLAIIAIANSSHQSLDKIVTLKDQALSKPQSIAVIDTNGSYTYAKLMDKSYSIASLLKKSGAQKRELVAIFSEKGYQQIAAAWGIMKTGAAYLPLNIDWPIGRIEEVLKEGLVRHILVSKNQLGRISFDTIKSEYQILVIDEAADLEIEIADIPMAELDETAYVLFTSGSTGKPKGVVISYLGVINTIKAINQRFKINQDDAILALSELSFDLSVYDMFGMLGAGGKVIFPDQDKVKEPSHWYELIEKHQITIWNTVPQIMQLLIDYVISQKKQLDSLRVVLLSGDWIPLNLPKQIKSLNPNITVMSLGGATEGSIWSCWYEINEIDETWKSIPYGIAMPNQKMYVLDSQGRHCPTNVIGEIYIGGIGVAIGYWNDSEKTKASFIPHDVLGRLYKTGDLGCWNKSGYIEFHGRKDFQVKINGYRIELEEITAKLNKINGINSSIVQVYPNAGRDYIIAYMVSQYSYLASDNSESQEFKLNLTGIRNDLPSATYKLNLTLAESKFVLRKSYRRYLSINISDDIVIDDILQYSIDTINQWINLDKQQNFQGVITATFLDEIFAVISAINLEERILPKYRYPSAGSSYAVRAYLNLPFVLNEYQSGYYYYNPLAKTLNDVDEVPHLAECLSKVPSIDLIVHYPAITPLYQEESFRFAYLEAGHMLALILEVVFKYNIPVAVEVLNNVIDADNMQLIRLKFGKEESIKIKPSVELNKLVKTVNGIYTNDNHQIDINQQDIFTRANWYSGRLLETGGMLLSFDGDRSPENLIYAGMYFQLASELLYQHNIGTCMLGYDIYENVLYSMVLGVIDESEKHKSESMTEDKAVSKYIEESLTHQLPEYMLPYEYVFVDKLPLTANGKVDLKQLPAPNFSCQNGVYIAPETPLESEVCQIIAKELGIKPENLGVEDDFFRIGGNSILAIRLTSHLNNSFDSNIKVSDIFVLKTVRHLANLIRTTRGDFIFKNYQIKENEGNNLYLPFSLNNVQQAYYLGRYASFELGNISTHSYSEHKFTKLDIKRLETALNHAIKRHPGLRAIFKDGEQQYLAEVLDYTVKYFEFSEYKDFYQLRESLSHKIYATHEYPLFDFIVSKCLFSDEEPYYILHISFDILLMDGNSARLLYDELTSLYHSSDLQFPALTVSYRDYIIQMEKIRASDLFIKDREYWLNKLPDYNFDLQLPLSCRVTDIEKPRFNKLTKVITSAVWEKIKAKALKYDVGLTSIIMVIYGKVLSYWSNQTSLCINLTLFNRIPLHPQINDILGDFTVLELFDYKNLEVEQKSIINEIRSNHEQLWQDIEHNLFDGIDFQRLIREEKQLVTNQVIAPVVLTSVLGDSKDKTQFLDESYLGKEYSSNQTSQVWLVNHAYTSGNDFIAEWNYVEQLFSQTTITSMHHDYCRLIEFLANADWDKDIFSEPNSANLSLIRQINLAQQPVSEDTLCDSLQSAIDTSKPAIIDNSCDVVRLYSYQELLFKSQLLARQIIEVDGLNQADKLIGILAEKGANQVISTLGVMFAGYAYLPLNVNWPIERIDEVLTGGKVSLLLISRKMAASFNQNVLSQKYQLIIIEDIVNETNPETLARLDKISLPLIKPDDIAYVIFTSGSTGKPKGVTISHRGALNTIHAVNDKYQISRDDRVLALSDLSFDLSVYDIFGMLCAGGTIIFPNQDRVKEPQYWQQLMTEHKITIWNSVPQLAELLIEDWQPLHNSTIRLFLLSGDWIPVTLPKRLSEACPLSTIVSLGGATEGSIWSIWYPINQLHSEWSSIPYGVAMPNQQIYVLNHNLQHCPDGVIGEIYIGGDGVALNYYHDDEKTSAAFINHPELGRLYKTGDSGKLNSDGYVEFMGRLDNQVKLNGYRVELSEISAKLLQLDGIADAIVQLTKINGNSHLVAYLVLDKNYPSLIGQNLAHELNANLEKILPEYMLPHRYITLEQLPLTANGKIDIRQLPVPEVITEINDCQKPINELEINILDIYSEVLKKDKEEISTHDSFFKLGGDSIIAIRLVSRLNKNLGLNIAVKDIFTYRNISELAGYISTSNLQNATQDYYIPFSLINRADYTDFSEFDQLEDAFPASNLQLGMLFESMSSQYSTYHVVISEKYKTRFDSAKFELIWNSLISKHALLRARFILSENSYDCLIYKNIQFSYSMYSDYSLNELIKIESQLGFDYSKAGLFRILVNQYDDKNEFDMVLSFHHAITDGWSISRLLNEFSAAYLFAKPVEAVQLELSYGAFIRQEQIYINNSKMTTFWQQYLAEIVVPTINWSDDKAESANGLNQSRFTLDDTISQKIQAYAHKLNVTSDCIFLFIYLSVLSRFLNQKDLTIGLVVNNRLEIAGGDDLFGLFLNTIPYRYNLGNNSIDEVIKDIYNQKIRLYEYKGFPYAKIKELFAHDLYQFMFNYTHFQINKDGRISSESNDYQRSNIPFVLNVAQGDYFIIDLIAHDSFCSKEYLDYLARNIEHTLIDIIEAGRNPSILDEDYTMQIAAVANNCYDFGLIHTLPELFTQQVAKTPDEIALIYNNQYVSYRELEQKTNQLAHYLLEKYTLKPDNLVVVCMERSEFIVIALLAVMKAGAAFVPVDPNYPEARINFILKDSNPKVILTVKNNCQQLGGILSNYNAENSEQKIGMLVVDDEENDFAAYPITLPQTNTIKDNLAYVIYTSGTTGQPKGVMIENKSLFNLLKNMVIVHKLAANKVVTVYSNYVFDAFICELLPPLVNGNQLILLSNEERLSLDLLAETLVSHGVNLAFIPSVLVGDFLNVIRDRATQLKMIFAGGDRLANINFEQIPQGLTILNEYGPTEATVCSTFNYLSSDDIITNIGKPLVNTSVYILDDDLQLLPIGAVGEIYISGEGLARGYLNQPELTDARFIPNPYRKDQDKNSRLYKTGDLAKYLPDGSLVFIGRNDSQIKINGHRIELSEIENTLIRTCKNIIQAIAMTKKNNQQVSQIIVYFIADNFIDTKKLHTTLDHYLPDYMLPQIFIQLDEFPLNINGKIDYKLLPDPELMSIANGYVAPFSEIEKQLCLIFGELLQLDGNKIGANDDFFILGGNSILTIRLVARLNKKFKISLKIADILANSSLDKLAQLVINSNSETGYRSLIKLNSSVNKPNMFMIHPGQAGCEVYAELAKELENHYSCYGVDNYNLHHQEKITDFNQLVVTYLDFIISQGYLSDKNIQVTLFGWSLGGLIALEIAAILEQLGYLNIRIYLLDTIVFDEQLRLYQNRAVNQKYQLRDFLVSQAYDSDYISKIFKNYDTEISLAQSPISNNLRYTKIVLFKAMQVGSQFDGDINIDMTLYILNLTTNNIECCLSDLAQLSVLNLNHAHHWNILEQKEIFDFITGS